MQVANLVGYDMPNCQSLFDWYEPLRNQKYGEFNYKRYGIDSTADFEQFYKQ